MKDITVLFEDNNIIAAIKPAGVLSQAGNTADMISLLGEGRGEIYPLHRLDKNVGGVMVFAKNKQAAAKMSQLISENRMSKSYYAVLCGKPEEDCAVLEDLLFKDSSKNKSFVVKRMRKGVKKASLEYKTVESVQTDSGFLTLVKVKLHTGRTHQIRVQFSSRKLPVKVKLHTGRTHQIRVQFSSRKLPLLGDGRYGGKSDKCDIALWSTEISFISPFDRQNLTFKAPLPQQYPWNLFNI